MADDNYPFTDYEEMDEGFDDGSLKSGCGSQRQTMVMVMCLTLFDHKYQFKCPGHKVKSAFRFAKIKSATSISL
jgi:hypothetical protein